ncbi:MAG: hypothetical protein AAF726_08685 [Planctomycetota bacterium]
MHVLASALVAFLHSPGYPPPPQYIDPYAAVSPDGRCRVEVEPSNRFGEGPATYRFTVDGAAAGVPRELDFTLHRAEVTNACVLVGYGIDGPRDCPDSRLVVAAVDSSGAIRWEHRLPKVPSDAERANWPAVFDMAVQHETNRLFLLANLPDHGDPKSPTAYRIRAYDVSDGALAADRGGSTGDEDAMDGVLAIDAIPDCELLLETRRVRRRIDRRVRVWIEFHLVDLQGATAWSTEWNDRDSVRAGGSTGSPMLRRPQVFETFPRGFRAWSASEEVQVRFDIAHNEDGTWSATPGDPEAIEPPRIVAAGVVEAQPIELEPIGVHPLEGLDPDRPRGDGPFEWHPLPGGRLTVLRTRFERDDRLETEVVTYAEDGTVEATLAVTGFPEEERAPFDERWAYGAAVGWFLLDPLAGPHVVDPDSGRLERTHVNATIDPLEASAAASALSAEGALAFIEDRHRKSRRLRVVRMDGGDAWVAPLPPDVDHVVALTWLGEERVAYVGVHDRVWTFDGAEAPSGPWPLADQSDDDFGLASPEYSPAWTTTVGGNVLAQSYDEARLVVLRPREEDATGPLFERTHAFTPRFPNGILSESLADRTRIDEDGVAWAFDGAQFHRMDHAGRIVESVGEPRSLDRLYHDSAASVLPRRVAVWDEFSGAVLLWTHRGERADFARPLLSDADGDSFSGAVESGPEETVWLGPFHDPETHLRRWRSDGLRLPSVPTEWIDSYTATPEGIWMWEEYGPPALHVGAGVSTKIERSADRRWIRSVREVEQVPGGPLLVLHDRHVGKDRFGLEAPKRVELLECELTDGAYQPIRATALPLSTSRIRATADWIIVAAGDEVLLRRTDGDAWLSFAVESDLFCSFLASEDGRELVGFAWGEYEVHRWALP